MTGGGDVPRADVCVVAIADAFRGDGEIMANPIGNIPMIGGRVAREVFEHDLVMTDGFALLVANPMPVGVDDAEKIVEAWNPYRTMFDVVWSGRRHVVMGASQIDPYGNQNFAFIGDWGRPKSQLLGMRGAPGNTVNHTTSYWIPNHTTRVFVPEVDVVSGVGYDRAAELGDWVRAHHEIRRVVTNLAVLDFATPDHRMRLASVHPGVTVDEVVEATGFELAIEGYDDGEVPESRVPTDEEVAAIAQVDPTGLRLQELPELMHARLHTRLCDLFGIDVPIVQTGMGWVAGPRLVSATAEAGALGILASATMDFRQLQHAIADVKTRTSRPFGVNLRADAADVTDRVKLLINEGVKVASFAQAPREDLIDALHDGGVLVVPSIGAKRHAEKVLQWGVDAVLVQGGEGGGHTGSVPTSLLLPQVVDAVNGAIPVIAAGGFDGRGLVAALAYGADGIAMGTRFLLTADSAVPESVKQFYLGKAVTETVVTTQVDGVPHRVLHTDLINDLESTRGRIWAFPRALRNAWEFRRMTGIPLRDMVREGLAMRKSMGLTWTQTLMAANTPMLLKAALVDGKVESGVMASGQVVGVIDDLPTCKELIDRIMSQADDVLQDLQGGKT